MTKSFETLTIKNFRGATQPLEISFDPQKKIMMLFGENGTGKSTIVDAIDFICNGNIGSLEDRSCSSKPIRYLPSIDKKPEDVAVVALFDGKTWSGTIVKQQVDISGPNGRPSAAVLRHAKILDLVVAEPKKRYEKLSAFIEIPHILSNEQTLRKACKSTKDDLDSAVRASNQAKDILQTNWKKEGSIGTSAEAWAEIQTKTDQTARRAIVAELKAFTTAIDSSNSALAVYDKRVAEIRQAQQDVENATKDVALASLKMAAQEADVLDMLKLAKVFIHKHPATNKCPVCENTIDADKTIARLDSRIAAMQELDVLQRTLTQKQNSLSRADKSLYDASEAMVNASKMLVALGLKAKSSYIGDLNIDWSGLSQKLSIDGGLSKEELELSKHIINIAHAEYDKLIDNNSKEQSAINQHNALTTELEKVKNSSKIIADTKRLSEYLQNVLEVYETARKTYVEQVLQTICADVENLYGKIHPNEELGQIKLSLNPKFQGSLEISAKFQGQSDIYPQAYYSESHLDTLGICVFLALQKHFKPDIVILDDVITSLDAPHISRFMPTMHEAAKSFNQMLITTHFRNWRDGYLGSGDIQFVELIDWALERGIWHTKTKLKIEELQTYLAAIPLNREGASAKAGILLERLFDHITLLYRCSLPRQAVAEYTLGTYFDAISKLKKHLYVETETNGAITKQTLEALIAAIDTMGWIRNKVGCHFNLDGGLVSDTDVKSFVSATIVLAEALVCSDCGILPIRRAGSHFECCCKHKKLYPLEKP